MTVEEKKKNSNTNLCKLDPCLSCPRSNRNTNGQHRQLLPYFETFMSVMVTRRTIVTVAFVFLNDHIENPIMKLASKSFENETHFKYFGSKITRQNTFTKK